MLGVKTAPNPQDAVDHRLRTAGLY